MAGFRGFDSVAGCLHSLGARSYTAATRAKHVGLASNRPSSHRAPHDRRAFVPSDPEFGFTVPMWQWWGFWRVL
jgi:hypothetical protein